MRNSAVIVGGGPGGAAAAIALAQRGVDNIVLVDKEGFPRDKTCGSGLSPNALVVIEQLGIADEVRRIGYPINSLRAVTRKGREIKLTTDQAAIVCLRRHFDNLLIERAKQLGVTVKTPFTAKELVRENGRVVGIRSSDEEIRADYTLVVDGANSVFSFDARPKHKIQTLMGWWENFPYEPNTLDMIFSKHVLPLYGWMFPEGPNRVNIGICIDGEDGKHAAGKRNVRDVFNAFLEENYSKQLAGARQIGKLKGHPISWTNWVQDVSAPGVVYVGEAARMTHNATGEGIFQAMQSGVFAANAVADIHSGVASEREAMRQYLWRCRKEFTVSFAMGHVVRALVDSPVLDGLASLYNNPMMRKLVTTVVGSALAGSTLTDRAGEAAAAAASSNGVGLHVPSSVVSL